MALTRTYTDGVLTVTNDAGEVLVLTSNPQTGKPWANEQQALNFPISSNYTFVAQDSARGREVFVLVPKVVTAGVAFDVTVEVRDTGDGFNLVAGFNDTFYIPLVDLTNDEFSQIIAVTLVDGAGTNATAAIAGSGIYGVASRFVQPVTLESLVISNDILAI